MNFSMNTPIFLSFRNQMRLVVDLEPLGFAIDFLLYTLKINCEGNEKSSLHN